MSALRTRYEKVVKPLRELKELAGLPPEVRSWEIDLLAELRPLIMRLGTGKMTRTAYDSAVLDLRIEKRAVARERRRTRILREERETLTIAGNVRLV